MKMGNRHWAVISIFHNQIFTTMKKFMYLFRGGDDQYASLSPEEMQSHMGRWAAWMEAISQPDMPAEGDPLHTDGKLVSNGGAMVTDGPFTEGKEVVGGYVVLPANDMDHAVELSKGCPIFEFGGTVEVRAIADMG